MLFEIQIKTLGPEHLEECWKRTKQRRQRNKDRGVIPWMLMFICFLPIWAHCRNHFLAPNVEPGKMTGSGDAVLCPFVNYSIFLTCETIQSLLTLSSQIAAS